MCSLWPCSFRISLIQFHTTLWCERRLTYSLQPINCNVPISTMKMYYHWLQITQSLLQLIGLGFYWINTDCIVTLLSHAHIHSCIFCETVKALSINLIHYIILTFNRQIIQSEFLPTWICVSLTRSTTSSEWKLFGFDKMEVKCFSKMLIDVTCLKGGT